VQLAQALAVQASRVRGDEVTPRDNPDEAVWLVSGDDRKPPDVLAYHMIHRIPKRRIVEHNTGRLLDDAAHGRGSHTAIEQVAPRDHSDETVVIVDHGKPLVCRPLRIESGPIRRRERLGGLLNFYERNAPRVRDRI